MVISNLALCFYKNATRSSGNEDKMDKAALERALEIRRENFYANRRERSNVASER